MSLLCELINKLISLFVEIFCILQQHLGNLMTGDVFFFTCEDGLVKSLNLIRKIETEIFYNLASVQKPKKKKQETASISVSKREITWPI